MVDKVEAGHWWVVTGVAGDDEQQIESNPSDRGDGGRAV